ncbi:MAG: NAD(P)-dependent oxidoreductase [Ostreibacterium sp.]
MHIGMIGLGTMGEPIAKLLHQQTEDFIGFTTNHLKLSSLTAYGMNVTDNINDLTKVELLFLCLPDDDAINQILFTNNLACQLRPNTIVVDLGTSSYHQTVEIAQKLADNSIAFMDAPISGMEKRAQEGSLTIMCGAQQAIFDIVEPYFQYFGKDILFMGEVGSGQLSKLINQLLFDINTAALAEILPFSVKMGLDPEKIATIVNSGTGRSYASAFFLPRMLAGDFTEGYSMQAAYKDLVSGAEMSVRQQIPLPILAAATATYQQALLEGYGKDNKGGMIKVYEHLLGVQFRQPLQHDEVSKK